MGLFDFLINSSDAGKKGNSSGKDYFDSIKTDPYNFESEKDPFLRNEQLRYLREEDPELFQDLSDD